MVNGIEIKEVTFIKATAYMPPQAQHGHKKSYMELDQEMPIGLKELLRIKETKYSMDILLAQSIRKL